MYAEVIHPETGEKFTLDLPNLTIPELDLMKKEYTTNEKVHTYIEQLSVSAELKVVLSKLAEFSITVGTTVVKMGKKILEMVIMLASKFKHATFGLILAALLTSLIAAIPLIGGFLAGFLGPIIALFGLGKGLWEDLKRDTPALAISINEAGSVFYPLNPITA